MVIKTGSSLKAITCVVKWLGFCGLNYTNLYIATSLSPKSGNVTVDAKVFVKHKEKSYNQ